MSGPWAQSPLNPLVPLDLFLPAPTIDNFDTPNVNAMQSVPMHQRDVMMDEQRRVNSPGVSSPATIKAQMFKNVVLKRYRSQNKVVHVPTDTAISAQIAGDDVSPMTPLNVEYQE